MNVKEAYYFYRQSLCSLLSCFTIFPLLSSDSNRASQLDELDWQILHLGQSRGSPTHPVPQHDHHSRSLKRSREEDEEKSLYSYGMLQNPNMVEREPRQSFPKTLKRPTRKISRHQQRDTAPRTLENPKSKESQKNRRIPRRLPIGQLPLVMDKITNEVEVHDGMLSSKSRLQYTVS
jgi:hypothetical protein